MFPELRWLRSIGLTTAYIIGGTVFAVLIFITIIAALLVAKP
jgi:hypothetical protein